MKYKAGLQIGRYVLKKLIAEGGEAEVWLVQHIDSPQLIRAMKLRRPARFDNREDVAKQRDAFINENNHWIEFSATNVYIGTLYDVVCEIVEEDGVEWVIYGIVSEYCELGDVAAAIDNDTLRTFLKTEVEFIEFLLNIISGVRAGHDVQKIHCDLKPSNILLFKQGLGIIPKLTDFGVSRSMLETVIGATPAYRAPELVANTQPNPKSDIYALGITFYEIYYAANRLGPRLRRQEFKSGEEYKHYLDTNADLTTQETEFKAIPYQALFHSMAKKAPADRPTLDEIWDELQSALRIAMASQPRYQVKTSADVYHWSPQVHEILGEDLYYILIKAGNPALEGEDILNDLRHAGATGFSLRTVTGEWDYVLRIWIPSVGAHFEPIYRALNRRDRNVLALKVSSSELHAQGRRMRPKTERELLRDIEATHGEGAFEKLKELGYVCCQLNPTTKAFRVTLLVSISHTQKTLASVFGDVIKKHIKNDKRAREISHYEVKSVGETQSNICLVVKFIHSDFVACRATLLGVFNSLAPRGNHFAFSTLFDMNADSDVLSDDGAIIARIQSAHSH